MHEETLRPSLEELLAQSTWAWDLARSLVRDAGAAEDALQEAWVKALERPPDLDAGRRSPRPWLAVVIRNALATRRRADERRVSRERVVARAEALPPVERALEREAARRTVVEAVLALPEPYRGVVLLRYFDGLTPAQIAAQQASSASTVRNRLSRAHELLRHRLRDERDSDGRSALALLLPWVSPRPLALPVSIGVLTMKLKLGLAAAVVLLAVLGSVWFAVRRAEPGAHDGSAAAPQSASVEGASGAAATETSGERVPTPALAPSSAPDADTLLVRVVERSSGAPVPGATVIYATSRSLSGGWTRLAPERTGDPERYLAELGTSGVTDERGELRIPRSDDTLRVGARAGERWGEASAGPAQADPLVIPVEHDIALRVLVVDDDERPVAGVPLSIAFVQIGRGTSEVGRPTLTGPDGIAHIAHAQSFAGRGQGAGEFIVQFAFPQAVSSGARIDLSRPDELLRLRLPPTGSVRVLLRDDTGAPAARRCLVSMHGVARDRTAQSSLATRFGCEAGVGVAPHVGLGLELALFGFADENELSPIDPRRVVGPRTAGEEVVVELVVSAPREPALLRTTVLGVDGAPLARAPVQAQLEFDPLNPDERPSDVSTDELGALAVRFNPRQRPSALRVLHRDAASGALEEGRATVPAAPTSSVDVSAIHLAPAPVLARGRVVDASGAARGGALVELLYSQGGGEELDQVARLGYASIEWETLSGRTANAGADGTFVVYGEPLGGAFALRASAAGFAASQRVAFEPGADDVTLVVEARCTLRGRVLLGDERLTPFVSVSADATDGRGDAMDDSLRRANAGAALDGSFELANVPNSALTISVTVAGERAWVFEGFRPGIDDAQLALIDLRERVFVHEIEVVDADGQSIDAGLLTFAAVGAAAGEGTALPVLSGLVLVRTTQAQIDVVVRCPGFREARATTREPRTRIVLAPPFEVRARLPKFDWGDEQLDIDVVFIPPDGERAQMVERSFERTWEVIVQLPRPGTWSVAWQLHDPVRDAWKSFHTGSVEVSEAAPTATLELPLAAKDLERIAADMVARRPR